MLLPIKAPKKPRPTRDDTNLLSLARFEEEMHDTGTVYVLVRKETEGEMMILDAIAPLIVEFVDIFLEELADGLPPLRYI